MSCGIQGSSWWPTGKYAY